MLLISRRIGEELVIADNIRVRVVEIKGNRIRLAMVAPADVVIQRCELASGEQSVGYELQPA